MNLNAVDWIALTLVIVGGLNWGLVGAFDYNLVTSIFGEESFMSRLVFGLVGLSAVYLLTTVAKLAGQGQSSNAS